MSERLNIVAEPGKPVIVLTRAFEAPRSLVFDVWTNPEHIRQWWGCKNATLIHCEADVRVGGAWRYVLRMPDGSEHPFKGVYQEIAAPERVVYTECYDQPSIGSPEWLTTVTFEERGGRTTLTSTSVYPSVEARDGHLASGMEQGVRDTFERIGELVEDLSARSIVVSRDFEAPRDLVFEAWTQPEHVAAWWGPNGFTNTVKEMDVRPGGVWRILMHGPDGVDYPNRIEYLEVERPARLVYDHSDDVEGAGLSFHVLVTFEENGGGTRLTMWMALPTAEARRMVVEKYGAIEGGTQTLERLGAHLAGMTQKAAG